MALSSVDFPVHTPFLMLSGCPTSWNPELHVFATRGMKDPHSTRLSAQKNVSHDDLECIYVHALHALQGCMDFDYSPCDVAVTLQIGISKASHVDGIYSHLGTRRCHQVDSGPWVRAKETVLLSGSQRELSEEEDLALCCLSCTSLNAWDDSQVNGSSCVCRWVRGLIAQETWRADSLPTPCFSAHRAAGARGVQPMMFFMYEIKWQ